VQHLRRDNFLRMGIELENDSELGAVALNRYAQIPVPSSHVLLGCVMYRTELLRNMIFKNKYGKCLCREVKEAIEGLGYNIRYLDDAVRYKELLYGTV